MKRITKELASGAVGVGQTVVLSKYVDPSFGTLVPQLGRFGTASGVTSVIAGIVGALGALKMVKGIGPVPGQYADLLAAYGLGAFASKLVLPYIMPSAVVASQGAFLRRSKPAAIKAPVAAQKTVQNAVKYYPELMTAERGIY